MKVVKLNRRHRLGKQGFTHAFRFDGWEPEMMTIENSLTRKYGLSWNNEKCWGSFYGKKSKVSGNRVFWIGVRNETLITQTLLSLK
jgi:hypothetical protein